jgi:hypothetical protein
MSDKIMFEVLALESLDQRSEWFHKRPSKAPDFILFDYSSHESAIEA